MANDPRLDDAGTNPNHAATPRNAPSIVRFKPVIGITSGTTKGWDTNGELWTPLRDSVERAGGRPVWIGANTFPSTESPELLDVLRRLDGLLLPGGADLSPRPGIYLDFPEPGDPAFIQRTAECELETSADRDDYEIPLVLEAIRLDMPVLGICRGFQLLNVACGGSLIPHLHTDLRHKAFSRQVSAQHDCRPVAGAAIAGLYGENAFPINSRHHQGLFDAQTAPGLQPTAFSSDGVVEAIEDPKRPWRFAVQWHPERPEESEFHERDQRLFRRFIDACRKR